MGYNSMMSNRSQNLRPAAFHTSLCGLSNICKYKRDSNPQPLSSYASTQPCSQTSDTAPASSKEFLVTQATIECGLTLKRVRDMIITYNQYPSIN